MNELPAPPDAASDPHATELLRAWVIDQAVHCTLNCGAFEDSATWGILLADLIQHVADALHEQEGRDRGTTIKTIRAALDQALDAPSQEGEPPT
jgi:hypothetical protein